MAAAPFVAAILTELEVAELVMELVMEVDASQTLNVSNCALGLFRESQRGKRTFT